MPPAIATTPLAACPTSHVQFCLDDRGKTLTKDWMIFDTQHANDQNGPFYEPIL
jgi:hypothetical protein